jgi:uracil-DNA glycosylase family 4
MFTGDRSGDFLYAALHRAGIANQPDSIDRDDGLQVSGAWIGAACRCAPPANKPTASQLKACLSYLVEEIQELAPRVVLALGGIAWTASLRALHAAGHEIPRPRPRFGHAVECDLGTLTLVGSYHVSQLNTFTGRLTPDMFDAVLHRVQELAAQGA